MTTTVHDPVCHMDIDPVTAPGTSDTMDKRITSVRLDARSPSTKNLKNISATLMIISAIIRFGRRTNV